MIKHYQSEVKYRKRGEMNMELRAAREKSGKTQAQVAREAGVSEVAYQRYEYDDREPRARTAIRIARAVGSTVEALFGAATPDGFKD